MAQDGPKAAPRWPKMAARRPKMAPKIGNKTAPDKMAQDSPKMAQDGPKIGLFLLEWVAGFLAPGAVAGRSAAARCHGGRTWSSSSNPTGSAGLARTQSRQRWQSKRSGRARVRSLLRGLGVQAWRPEPAVGRKTAGGRKTAVGRRGLRRQRLATQRGLATPACRQFLQLRCEVPSVSPGVWPEMAQDGSRWPLSGPKMAQHRRKTGQDGPQDRHQDGPIWPKTAPRWPKIAEDGSRSPKLSTRSNSQLRGPRRSRNGPKMAPRWPQDGPKTVPRRPQDRLVLGL